MGHYLPPLLGVCLVLLPSVNCGPQYGHSEEVWEEVPITLLPGDSGCEPLQQPRKEPEMMKLHEEFQQIEVIKATGNNKCDFYKETQGFECVPYYQCDDGTIITDGFGLIDIRFGGTDAAEPELAVLDSTDLMCPGSLDVCCKDPDFVKATPAPFTQEEAEPESEPEPEPVVSDSDYQQLTQQEPEPEPEPLVDDVFVIDPYTNEPEPFKS